LLQRYTRRSGITRDGKISSDCRFVTKTEILDAPGLPANTLPIRFQHEVMENIQQASQYRR